MTTLPNLKARVIAIELGCDITPPPGELQGNYKARIERVAQELGVDLYYTDAELMELSDGP